MKKYEKVEAWIRSGISGRRILPGEKLPSENELSRQFGVSRNVVRQALGNLVHDGWIESVRGVGAFSRPHNPARQLTNNIGFVCFFSGSYIFPEIIRGCDHVLYQQGFHLLLNQSEYDLRKERNILLNLRAKGVDGIIIEPVYGGGDVEESNASLLLELQSEGIAVVLCDNSYPGSAFSYIRQDDREGGRIAASFLWEHGHRDIGVFYENDHQAKLQRRAGVEEFLREQGRPMPQCWSVGFAGQGPDSGAAGQAQALFESRKDLPTAFVCSSDEDALSLVREARRHDIHIPGDLSIIGFDDSSIAQLEEVSLTTVQHPSYFFGETATSMLLEQIHHPELSIVTHKWVVPRLIERRSVRAL